MVYNLTDTPPSGLSSYQIFEFTLNRYNPQLGLEMLQQPPASVSLSVSFCPV